MVQQGGTETQNDFNPQGAVFWGHTLTTMLFGNEMCLVHLCTGKLQKLQVTWLRLSAQELNSVSNSLSQHGTAHCWPGSVYIQNQAFTIPDAR